jgi:uncharacterized membrane protein YfcA
VIYRELELIAAGAGGGIAGSVASIASIVSYPALLALGLPPLSANVTNTMSLVFAVPGAMLGSRPELAGQRSRVIRIGAIMAVGGALGAAILLLAPPGAFALVVPVLIGFAAAAVLVQPRLAPLGPAPGAERSRWRLAAMFGVAVYLGYFGAAGGVLLLALLAATLSESLIRVNAIKNVVAGAANLVAAALFARYAPVEWAFVPALSLGFLVGGYIGQRLVRHLPVAILRGVVALAGFGLAVKLGISAYLCALSDKREYLRKTDLSCNPKKYLHNKLQCAMVWIATKRLASLAALLGGLVTPAARGSGNPSSLVGAGDKGSQFSRG